jgi:hypothetical protein
MEKWRYSTTHFGTRCRWLVGKRFAADEEVETDVRKRLRLQSKDFHAAGFNAQLKRWDKCINVGGGYVEKLMFLPGSNITCFTFSIRLCDCPS